MRTRLLLPALVALAAVSLGAQTQVIQPSKPEPATEVRTLPLASGSHLKVSNVNGAVRVTAWDQEQVEFKGTFKPSSKDEHVKVVIEPKGKGLEIRGEYPKHHGWGSYRGPEVQMELKVPRRVMAEVENVNGAVELTGTQGRANLETVNGAIVVKDVAEGLEAETVNGAIKLEGVKGALDLETVNGGIEARGLDSQGQGVKIETVNGAVRLQTTGLKGHLHATTVNGGVSFKAQGAEQVEVKRGKVTATFPGSDQSLSISTVNGSITLE